MLDVNGPRGPAVGGGSCPHRSGEFRLVKSGGRLHLFCRLCRRFKVEPPEVAQPQESLLESVAKGVVGRVRAAYLALTA